MEIDALFKVLLTGAIILWLLVNGLFFHVTRRNPRAMSRKLAETLIIGGGIVFPTVVLGMLLGYSLNLMGSQSEPGDASTRVEVIGKQWWWQVRYVRDGDVTVTTANELRLPLGQRTEITLLSDKVIHSFWIPALAGKMDMFPGRTTRLALEPQKLGTFRGQCAEFCGTSHALMAFQAIVMPEQEFETWLDRESLPAADPADDQARQGKQVFLREGCGACHRIRGTVANGQTGPDLTHVGSRSTLGAGTLPVTAESFTQWTSHVDTFKPDAFMPAYDHLDSSDLEALGHYLMGLN